jgi:glycerol-3-phosphate acyltransferase PlsY
MDEFLTLLLAYCIGSIPTALIVSKFFFGIDIRDYGSGNMGATNTFRVLGSRYGTYVMAVDMLKGVIAVKLFLLLPYYTDPIHSVDRLNLEIGLGLSAVVGHIFPLWADFKGGKGVATLFGMVLAIQPVVALICVGVFLLVLYSTRFVSLSSMFAGIAFAVFVLYIFDSHETLYRVFAVSVALLVLITHQKNIGRLVRGNESKAGILKYRDRRKNRKRETGED